MRRSSLKLTEQKVISDVMEANTLKKSSHFSCNALANISITHNRPGQSRVTKKWKKKPSNFFNQIWRDEKPLSDWLAKKLYQRMQFCWTLSQMLMHLFFSLYFMFCYVQVYRITITREIQICKQILINYKWNLRLNSA